MQGTRRPERRGSLPAFHCLTFSLAVTAPPQAPGLRLPAENVTFVEASFLHGRVPPEQSQRIPSRSRFRSAYRQGSLDGTESLEAGGVGHSATRPKGYPKRGQKQPTCQRGPEGTEGEAPDGTDGMTTSEAKPNCKHHYGRKKGSVVNSECGNMVAV